MTGFMASLIAVERKPSIHVVDGDVDVPIVVKIGETASPTGPLVCQTHLSTGTDFTELPVTQVLEQKLALSESD